MYNIPNIFHKVNFSEDDVRSIIAEIIDIREQFNTNISSNNPVSIKWILKILKNEFGRILIKKRSRQRSEVYKTHGSNLKVIKETNFQKFTNISVGLTNVIKWAKKNIHYIK